MCCRSSAGWGDPNAAHEPPPPANGPSAIAAAPWAAAAGGGAGGAWGGAPPPPRRVGPTKVDEFPSLGGPGAKGAEQPAPTAGGPPPPPPRERPGWDADERSLAPGPGEDLILLLQYSAFDEDRAWVARRYLSAGFVAVLMQGGFPGSAAVVALHIF